MGALGWCARSDFRRQLAAAGRLGPAEAWRSRSAILLSCGDPVIEDGARRALGAAWGIDEVVCVVTPIRAIAAPDPHSSPWLRAWLAREIRDLAPAVVAIAAHPSCMHIHDAVGSGASGPTPLELRAAVAQLREWGVDRTIQPLWLRS
jgi:hypothetical protein